MTGSSTSTRIYAVGLGANMGERLSHLDRALTRIDRMPGAAVLATAQIFDSEGWGRPNLKPFLNTALAVRSPQPPHEFLRELQRIENGLGRQRELKWGPRVIDLDLLADDRGSRINDEQLVLPHPWIAGRPFVYLPLRELTSIVPAWEQLAIPTAEAVAIEKDTRLAHRGTVLWGRSLDPGLAEAVINTASEEETTAFARGLAAYLLPGDVVALNAPMGAGKSVFARGLARGLGISGPIQSPTFTLCRSYDAHNLTFEHWDFYRLSSTDELESTGFFTPESARAIRVIEWAENFPRALGQPLLEATITITGPDSRAIRLRSPAGRLPYPVAALAMTR